jgi:hypothetical protein
VGQGNAEGVGIGSHLHVSGAHLAVALESGRIFLWGNNTGAEWTDAQTCGEAGVGGRANWECHFLSPSSCALADALGGGAVDVDTIAGPLAQGQRHKVPAELAERYAAIRPRALPDEALHWWRAQSVAYLMRLNAATVRVVAGLRANASMLAVTPKHAGALNTVPFPPGVIHAHVRHGDKATEMALLETPAYFLAAEGLVRAQPLAFSRALFLSTEDPLVVDEAAGFAPRWAVIASRIPRLAVVDGRRGTEGPVEQVRLLGAPAGVTVRSYLLQLLMALECDGWVGTRASNWNRLVDELRCVWVDKCLQPYVEASTAPADAGYFYSWRR